MHGLGNDFVIFNLMTQPYAFSRQQIQHIADRHYGIGCDQVLLVEPSDQPDVHFRYRIFNADGSEVEQCGNGARCFARFVQAQGLTSDPEIRVTTQSGLITLQVQADGQVTVNMGPPHFTPTTIPFQADTLANHYTLLVDGEPHQLGVVSMGNPHAILQVTDLATAPVQRLGGQIEHHPRFPQRVNVGFMQVLTPQHICLRVFERGVGETQACGTGACAAAVIGQRWGLLEMPVTVSLPGGDLTIAWAGEGAPVLMTGEAIMVFEGTIEL